MQMRIALSALMLASVALVSPHAKAQSYPNRPVPDFNVMLNDDGDWSFMGKTPEAWRNNLAVAVDGMAASGVKTYVRCVALGSDVMYYPTEAGSTVAWREVPADNSRYEILTRSKNGIDAGIDPIRISGERCKKVGLRFFPSYRMNDAHFSREAEKSPIVGKFYVDNFPRLVIPKANRLDFTHKEVRDYRLGIIFEVLERYQDISDGIELDFNRHAMYFPLDKAKESAPLLTEIVQKVREKLDAMEKKNGRPYYLIVRVQPSLENSLYCGMDVADWMKRRLVDVVVPAQIYSIAHEMPIAGMIAVARKSGCKVYPAIYERTQFTWPIVKKPTEASYASDGKSVPTVELFAGASANYFAMGADGFEMYNMRPPLGPIGLAASRLLSSPAMLTAQNRTYTITPAHGSDIRKTPADATKGDVFQFLKQIPAEIKPGGKGLELELLVGDDLSADSAPAKPSYAALRLGLRGIKPEAKLRVSFNGHSLLNGPVTKYMTRVTGGPTELPAAIWPALPQYYLQLPIANLGLIKQGNNSIQIQLLDADANGDIKPTVMEAQLGIFFDDSFPRRI